MNPDNSPHNSSKCSLRYSQPASHVASSGSLKPPSPKRIHAGLHTINVHVHQAALALLAQATQPATPSLLPVHPAFACPLTQPATPSVPGMSSPSYAARQARCLSREERIYQLKDQHDQRRRPHAGAVLEARRFDRCWSNPSEGVVCERNRDPSRTTNSVGGLSL